MRVELIVSTAVVALVAASPAQAQAQAEMRRYDIEAQDLAAALRHFASVSGREVLAPAELVAGRRSGGVTGQYAPGDALARLLAGTGLRVEVIEGAFVLRPFGGGLAQPQETPQEPEGEIVVTGSRIRGAPVASPVIVLGQESIRDSGQATVAEAARAIPQNFGGGQNPGVGRNVPASSGVDVGGGASINLRGLGSDATLTLLNGHRMPYSASRQSIDISAIPLGAVDRIEVVADGASALYGSDAVAGVANIILKRDYEGFETRARLGAATEGGAFSQLYAVTGGGTWTGGGLLLSYEFVRDAPIYARQRPLGGSDPELTFLPALKHHNIVGTGHQDLGGGLELDFDGYYNWRSSWAQYSTNATSRINVPATVENFALAPSLKLSVDTWRATLLGTYGQDHLVVATNTYTLAGALTSTIPNMYRNSARAIEANADGPLFALPGGSAKLAIGAGYRSNHFENFRGSANISNIDRSQDSYFAYGELSVPLISPDRQMPLVDRLNLSAALRYERYPGIGEIATPKLGLIYGVSPDLEFKASWGKSYRAPTFYQRYQLQSLYLAPPSIFGGSYPAGSAVLYAEGGNSALQAERATSWSATAVLHPRGAPGLRLEASYFHVAYRDRIVTPLIYASQALSNPLYRDSVTLTPSAAAQAAIIAGAGEFRNLTGGVYDPTKVVAIIDNSNVNAAQQTVQGVDILGSYRLDLGASGGLRIAVNASYLQSDQRLSALQPQTVLAGTLFNPAHWRGRATAAWDSGGLVVEGAFNYTGGVSDVRSTPAAWISPVATVDLTLRYRTGDGYGPLSNLDLTLSAANLFDALPDRIATTLPYEAPYDSTNYSPVGRFVSFGIAKRW